MIRDSLSCLCSLQSPLQVVINDISIYYYYLDIDFFLLQVESEARTSIMHDDCALQPLNLGKCQFILMNVRDVIAKILQT